MAILIQTARPVQFVALTQLLTRNQLSADDLPANLSNFWLALDDDSIIGSVGIDVYDKIGLLRSLCVDADYRNQKIARQLYETAYLEACRQELSTLYLLTTTADDYFKRLGFEYVARTSAPDSIQQTRQFSSLCPFSTIVMKRTL